MKKQKQIHIIPVLLSAIFLGILMHILIVLFLPNLSDKDIFASAKQIVSSNKFAVLPNLRTGDLNPHNRDPDFIEAICYGSVTDAPILVTANLPRTFWAVNVYNPNGTIALSTTNNTDDPQAVRLALLNPVQTTLYSRQTIKIAENFTVAELDGNEFFVLLRLWPPYHANRQRYKEIAEQSSCRFLS